MLLVHWKLLVIAPLIAGALAYAGSFLLQTSFASYAYIGPLDEDTATRSTALVYSPAVLEPAMRGLPEAVLSTVAADQRMAYIRQRLQIRPTNAANPKLRQLYVIEAVDSDPARAQAMLTSVVKAWVVAMKPPPDRAASLERLKEAYEFQAATLGPTVLSLAKDPGLLKPDSRSEQGFRGLSELAKLRTEGVVRSEELKAALAGPGNDSIVLAPTVASTAVAPARLRYAAAAAGIVFAVLCAYFLARDVLLPALGNSAVGAEMRRIRARLRKGPANA